MQLTNEQFLQLLGAKEVEIYCLKLQVKELQALLQKTKEEDES